MQEEKLRLRGLRVGALPILNRFIERIGKAVQLKRGHSKERRPDLKQLVHSLCVTADGAVPVHFKAYFQSPTLDNLH